MILTSHPALHSCTIKSKEWVARPGMMCAILALAGSSGMARVYGCVQLTRALPGSFTLSGFFASWRSVVGAAMTKKWLVAPESRMAHSWTFYMLMSTVASSALAAYSYLLEVGYRLCC